MKSTSLLLTRVLYCSLLLKKSTFIQFILSLSLKPIHIGWFVLGCWWSGAKWWSFSSDLTLSFFSIKNCLSKSTCFVGWWQCRLICLVWINFCTIGVVFVLGWWLFMGIWLIWILSSLLPISRLLYGVCLCDFGKRNIIFIWNWNRVLSLM